MDLFNKDFSMEITMADIIKILDKKNKKEKSDKEAREILKPTCDDELSEEDYPTIKDDE